MALSIRRRTPVAPWLTNSRAKRQSVLWFVHASDDWFNGQRASKCPTASKGLFGGLRVYSFRVSVGSSSTWHRKASKQIVSFFSCFWVNYQFKCLPPFQRSATLMNHPMGKVWYHLGPGLMPKMTDPPTVLWLMGANSSSLLLHFGLWSFATALFLQTKRFVNSPFLTKGKHLSLMIIFDWGSGSVIMDRVTVRVQLSKQFNCSLQQTRF